MTTRGPKTWLRQDKNIWGQKKKPTRYKYEERVREEDRNRQDSTQRDR